MGQRCSLKRRLPPKIFGEVYDLAKSGRYTIADMVCLMEERGYVISHSAMGRFIKRVHGPEGVVRAWMALNPNKVTALANLIESDPTIDFSRFVCASWVQAK